MKKKKIVTFLLNSFILHCISICNPTFKCHIHTHNNNDSNNEKNNVPIYITQIYIYRIGPDYIFVWGVKLSIAMQIIIKESDFLFHHEKYMPTAIPTEPSKNMNSGSWWKMCQVAFRKICVNCHSVNYVPTAIPIDPSKWKILKGTRKMTRPLCLWLMHVLKF